MSWTTLAGIDDLPGHLAGYGPITADQARALAADGAWRRLLTDPATGVLLDYGHTVYRPPQALQDFVRARDVTCTFPTRHTPAHRTEIDHHHRGRTAGRPAPQLRRPLRVDQPRQNLVPLAGPPPPRRRGLRWTSPSGIVTERPATQIGPTDTEQAQAAARKHPPDPDPPPF